MRLLYKGDQLVTNAGARPAERLYITVTRVARDRSWADLRIQTWAVMWTKRMPLEANGLPPGCVMQQWSDRNLKEQMDDWERKRVGL